MGLARRRQNLRSRRWFLFSLPVAALASRGTTAVFPAASHADAATDLPVVRLTNPEFSSFLPPPYAYAIARRGNFLLYASDATGRMETYRLDIKKGESRQLTEAESLRGLTMLPDERGFLYIDGDRLMAATISSLTPRELYQAGEGSEVRPGIGVSVDGLYAAVVERKGALERLQLVNLRTGQVTLLAEAGEPMGDPQPRPKRASVLYRRGADFWLANYDGRQDYRLRIAPGEIGPAQWSPDGRTLLYLNYPSEAGKLHNIREFVPDTNEDHPVADTTQYVGFRSNADASMFVGASGSKASPYILVLARKVNRELTLCEHRASDPAMVAPIFSANSQQIFFTSDMHGKPAIYQMDVARMVEQTGEDA
jgi:oligogalacturonide lyase